MKTFASSLLCAALALGCGTGRAVAAPDSAATGSRIGVYDSRAIAVAYAGSPVHEQRLAAATAERRKARESRDSTTVSRIEAEGQAQQKLLHRQAFGQEPVDDILAQIPAEVAAVRKAHDIAVLVSKWDEAALAAQRGWETVDITEALVDALRPNARQRQRALEIRAQPPAKN
ncbi:MAG TPA: hypothetical protein PK322_05570 [Opitutaceae bacterium]|nr:hypothetical protein [Opitutaceae bacterium]